VIADAVPQLVNADGGATPIGVWILMAIMAGAFGIWGYNQILGAQLKKKQLAAPPITQLQNPQPFEVTISKTLEEKFVDRDAFKVLDTKVESNKREIVESIRKQAEVIEGLSHDAQKRGEQLAALTADSKTQTRQLASIDENIGKLREDLGFQKGRTERRT
jgi:hypothetical protein